MSYIQDVSDASHVKSVQMISDSWRDVQRAQSVNELRNYDSIINLDFPSDFCVGLFPKRLKLFASGKANECDLVMNEAKRIGSGC